MDIVFDEKPLLTLGSQVRPVYSDVHFLNFMKCLKNNE